MAQPDIIHDRAFVMHQRLDAPEDISQLDGGDPRGPEAQRPDIARLPGTAAQLIGERIRAMYTKLAREPVPGQLLELIRQLENKERSE